MTDHQPVLLAAAIKLLAPRAGESYLDLTAGYGGHARLMDVHVGKGSMTLVDRDEQAIAHLKQQFGDTAEIIHEDYETAVTQLADSGRQFDMILLDLGVSSPQLAEPARGFSFAYDGPLDMRMDRRQQTTAGDIVNRTRESELADLIYRYGGERRSRQVARAIVANRPITTTRVLADTVASVVRRSGRIHPATRTFQALRIAVNDELGQLERTLPRLPELMRPGGRLAVISFHSLEDRLVKRFIQARSRGKAPVLTNLTKQVMDGRTYDPSNPRARSAKLRAASKQK